MYEKIAGGRALLKKVLSLYFEAINNTYNPRDR